MKFYIELTEKQISTLCMALAESQANELRLADRCSDSIKKAAHREKAASYIYMSLHLNNQAKQI